MRGGMTSSAGSAASPEAGHETAPHFHQQRAEGARTRAAAVAGLIAYRPMKSANRPILRSKP